MGEETSNFKWSLGNEELVLNFNHILKGEVIESDSRIEQMPDGTPYTVQTLGWKKVTDALLNTKGIQRITTILYSFANKNTFLSNLSESRAMELARSSLFTANDILFWDAEEFGVTPENLDFIITELIGQIVPSMLRPVDEGERKFHVKQSTEQTQIISNNRPQSQQGVFRG